ncbi:ribosome silencing factor [Rhodococcus sp. BP-349]|uniref:Ribosomal silencing factor RsfS n=1 Tax=Rhodococcoides corynebacterioides TaxID=53972 RepID=A0ABS2KTP9_9NOCA|nr:MULTISPECIES: ribosome silencing factor [Rhodococcus]KQU30428.1 Iojap family protein [Rhodococcus sp. Leaf225]KQU44667.1 Iojap family protein [Rhodococcus sp. Leaf258]MBM7415312.1 ribosome-associated protein [Rhodococcus corynebacterioides]MBP1117774.1 ribosome-associated protein [Rhodococcus sp. PvP016]MBY6540561.1 ribosome silencing factor [Rhodococcus sp. BP-363]
MSATPEAIRVASIAALAADEKLAADVMALDVSDQLVITDCFVIASAPNERQVNAIVENIEEKLREAGSQPVRREGTREGRWALLDYVDVVVHVLHNDERHFYALERLWKDCPVLEIEGLGATDTSTQYGTDDHGVDDALDHGVDRVTEPDE